MTEPLEAVFLDTNVLSWFLQGRDDPLTEGYRELVGSRPVVLPFQVVAEVRYGMLRARWGELRVRRAERGLAEFAIAQPDDETLTVYAQLRLRAIQIGHPLGDKVHDGDRWIGATAVRAHRPLVSHDAVFQNVEGLDIWTTLS